MVYTLNIYGKEVVDRFIDKCKADGSYKRVFEDFEDGTYLLEESIENVYDFCAWLYLTYDRYAVDTLDEWKSMDDRYAWRFYSKENPEEVIELSYEEVENKLCKMFDKK